jgi:hypothetical protein
MMRAMIASLLSACLALAAQDVPLAAPPAAASAPSPAPAVVDVAPVPKRVMRVAVYDLAAAGVDERVARLVTSTLVVELRKLQNVSVVSMEEVRAMLQYEADKQLLGCAEGAKCHSTIGEALGVDQLVVGELALVNDESTLSLRRIDQAQARVVDSFTVRLVPEGGEELLAAVGPAVEKLFKDVPLKPGVTRGVAPELALQVNPPPLPAWATVTTGVASGLLLVAGVVAGTSAASEKATFDGLAERARGQDVQAALLNESASRAQGWAGAANGLYGGAAAVGVATTVMFFFTDWAGARDARID